MEGGLLKPSCILALGSGVGDCQIKVYFVAARETGWVWWLGRCSHFGILASAWDQIQSRGHSLGAELGTIKLRPSQR